jgi:HD-GYP domain-containing protein (c-di-GMP phosphodiesterase class II)
MSVELLTNENTLEQLNHRVPLVVKVEAVHAVLKDHLPFVDRVAADLYDAASDLLITFVQSGGRHAPLLSHQTPLAEVPALCEILHSGRPGVMVNELGRSRQGPHQLKYRNGHSAYRSTCAMPMYYNGDFFGFLWFNSREAGVFEPHALHTLDIFGHLISLVIIDELSSVRVLSGVIKAARTFTIQRDHETGTHVDRVAHYVRIIARDLAPRHGFDDAYIDQLFRFAPLHDVGKIAIPDSILLKPGKLSAQEFEVMKTHTIRGQQLVDELIADFGLDGMKGIDTLRNIATFHHEALNGTGYPLGLKAAEIPLEARILAVADVFDALTSKRPYKQAFSNEEAFTVLKQMSGTKLDPECVDAFVSHKDEILQIQTRFSEDMFG